MELKLALTGANMAPREGEGTSGLMKDDDFPTSKDSGSRGEEWKKLDLVVDGMSIPPSTETPSLRGDPGPSMSEARLSALAEILGAP